MMFSSQRKAGENTSAEILSDSQLKYENHKEQFQRLNKALTSSYNRAVEKAKAET